MTDQTPWADVPCIELPVYRAACPFCGCESHKLDRSDPNGDGTRTRKAICDACRKRFKIVVTPQTLPAAGVWQLDTP